MGIMIGSDISKQYLLEENAVEGFKIAVNNGQVRLALQILTEVIDGIMEIFDHVFSEEAEQQIEAQEVPVTIQTSATEDKVEEAPVVEEKKQASAKKSPTTKTEEKAEPASE